jgi:aspartate/methionine/tyrosine aminotransferase
MRSFEESSRMAAVQQPVIPAVGRLIRKHPGTISLGQGVVHYPPPPQAIERIATFLRDPDNHKYKLVDGIPELLERLAGKLDTENGIRTGAASRIVVTAGGNMAFINAALAVTSPGDEVILLAPYYFNHEMAIRFVGCHPVVVETGPGFLPDAEAIGAAITPRTRAVVTISPNNPSGAVYPRALLERINTLCAGAGVFHIHDEAYEYFVHGGTRHVSPGSFPGAEDHTISLYSLSKSYGMASWRVGYMVIPARLHGAVAKVQDTNLICPPVISQHAACGALEAGRAFVTARVAALGEVRGAVLERLAALGDLVEEPTSDGAFYILLSVRTAIGPMVLVERLIAEHGVAVIPGSTFGLGNGCALRVSYGALEPDTVAEGVGRLVEGLRRILVA